MGTDALSYAIDEQDHLVRADRGYYAFGEENGWDGVGESLGRVLWDFVHGEELRKLQKMLLRRIRNDLRLIELPLRCDGPDVRREMRMKIAANRSGRVVLFTARVESEEEREAPQPLLDPSAPRGETSVEMCGWCDRFLVGGDWVEVEEAARKLELFRHAELPAIDYSVCPRCRALLAGA